MEATACSQGSHRQATGKPRGSLWEPSVSLSGPRWHTRAQPFLQPLTPQPSTSSSSAPPCHFPSALCHRPQSAIGNRKSAIGNESPLPPSPNPCSVRVPSVAEPHLALDKRRRRALDSAVSAIGVRCYRLERVSRAPCAGRIPAASGMAGWPGLGHGLALSLNPQPCPPAPPPSQTHETGATYRSQSCTMPCTHRWLIILFGIWSSPV